MHIDTMRRIDRLAGVPLCFLATLLVRLQDRLRPPPADGPRNVLFLELSEMGAVVLADPALRKLARETGANLHFAIFARNRPSLDLLNTIPPENVFTLDGDSPWRLAADALRFLAWTRARRIDTVVDLELFARVTQLLSGLSGAARRVGFHRFHAEGLYRGGMLTHRVAYNPHQHIARNYVALVNALLAPVPEHPYSKTVIGADEIRITEVTPAAAALAHVRGLITARFPGLDRHRLVLLNPNAGDLLPHRRWPPERFVALARLVLDAWPDALVLLTGTAGEAPAVAALAAQVGHRRCLSFAGALSLAELPALYAQAAVMVTNDSGPGHFAAVTALPTIVLFGPETPALYGPLGRNARALTAGLACSPCVSAANHRRTACTDAVCMRAIGVEEVLAAVGEVLGRVEDAELVV